MGHVVGFLHCPLASVRIKPTNGHFFVRGESTFSRAMAKKTAAQPDQESDSEDESVEQDYSCPDKAAKERRRRAVLAPAKAAKAPKRSATAKCTARDAAAKVAADDHTSGHRQLSANLEW